MLLRTFWSATPCSPIGLTHKGGFQKQWSYNIKLVLSLLMVLCLDTNNPVSGMHLALLKGVMTHFLSSSGCWSHGGHTLSSLVSCMPLHCNLSNKGKRWQNLEKNCNASGPTFAKLLGKNIMHAAIPVAWCFRTRIQKMVIISDSPPFFFFFNDWSSYFAVVT